VRGRGVSAAHAARQDTCHQCARGHFVDRLRIVMAWRGKDSRRAERFYGLSDHLQRGSRVLSLVYSRAAARSASDDTTELHN
jgi:hypothetical protein